MTWGSSKGEEGKGFVRVKYGRDSRKYLRLSEDWPAFPRVVHRQLGKVGSIVTLGVAKRAKESRLSTIDDSARGAFVDGR